ncbi:hypothetical protein [Gemmata sp.]|uniref:hypothetical protein n=1 Tax=Gemmata sp. TaxID=1914242 RepID=UPI003F6FC44F
MRKVVVLLAYLGALAFGTDRAFAPTLRSGFDRVQADRGDSVLNHYILEHSWQALGDPDYCGTLFSPPCFYPTRSTLWYSEHLLGVAPLYWALRAVTDHVTAYQWWMIVLSGLNFVAFAAVVRWLRGPHPLAVLGGYLWAFGLIHLDQIKHQQMIPRFAMVLAVYHAWRLVLALGSSAGNPARHLNRLCAAVALQAVTCVNTGWFLVSGLGTFLALAVVLQPGGVRDLLRFLVRERWRGGLVVGGWTAAMVAAYVPYFVVNRGRERGYFECIEHLPPPQAWLAPLPGTPWDWLLGRFRTGVIDEAWLFCGFGLDLLFLAATVALVWRVAARGRQREAAVILAALLTAAAWVVLTLKFGEEDSLWRYVRHVPGGGAVRAVSRVYVTVYLFGSLGAIVWLARATERLPGGGRAVLLWLVTAACVAEQLGYEQPSFERKDFYPIADAAAAELRKGEVGYVNPPYTDTKGVRPGGDARGAAHDSVLGMWAGLRANVPVVNGYSGRVPNIEFLEVLMTTDEYRIKHLKQWLSGRFRGRVAVVYPDDLGGTRVIEVE